MWLKFIFIIFCYILQSAALNPATNTKNESHHKHLNHSLTEIDPKSVGGMPVAITSAPWQVSVRLKSFDEIQYGYGHICGGSVISRRIIVSAAHCALRSDVTPAVYRKPNEFKLVMGSVYLYEITPLTLQFDVLEIVPHPDFKLESLRNDIALFFIDGHIPSNHPTVAPIPLNKLTLEADMNCTVTGWRMTESGTNWPVLLGAAVSIVESAHCNASYKGNITRGMICAGYTSTDGMPACQGDSGGPLTCKKSLAGIVSWGTSCAESKYPAVYTEISEYRNWMLSTNSTFDYGRYGGAAGLGVDQRQLVWGILSVLVILTWSQGV